jgi:hypothetical protein
MLWPAGARLRFQRQLKSHELVAAFRRCIDSGHQFFGILFQDKDVVGAQHDKRELPASQVLLIFEALVRRNHDVEAVGFGVSQKLAIDKAPPT